jgi:hypothetical protein
LSLLLQPSTGSCLCFVTKSPTPPHLELSPWKQYKRFVLIEIQNPGSQSWHLVVNPEQRIHEVIT